MSNRPPSAPSSPPDRTRIAPRPPAQRSAVTNRSKLFISGDESSPWARRFRDLCELHLADLGEPENLSEIQINLVRRLATLSLWCEEQEAAMSRGEVVNMEIYARVQGHARRTAETLGIKRERREKTLAEQMREIEGR